MVPQPISSDPKNSPPPSDQLSYQSSSAGVSPTDGREKNSIADLLLHAAATRPDAEIRYVTSGTGEPVRQTYAELLNDARRVLGGLRRRGLAPGDRVILLFEQTRDFIPAIWGCVLGGFVLCPILPKRADHALWAAHLEHVHGLLGSRLLVTSDALRREMPQVADLPTASLDELARAEPATELHGAGRDDLALLMLTSGSTGNAKAARLTHGNLLASMSGKAERLAPTGADVTLNWIAFDHVAAVEGHLLPLSVGAHQVQVLPSVIIEDPLRLLRLVDAHRVALTFAPNFLLGEINKALEQGPADFRPDLSSLRVLISGGEAVVCATAHAFLDRLAGYGLPRTAVVPAFGMTETCAGSVFSREFPDVDADEDFASLGLPIRGLEMRVVDEDDVPVPDGEPGELQVRGPMVFDGYFNNAAATEEAFAPGGWFRTGDLGRLSDGRLSLVGRSKDSIVVNGVSYFSHDLETVLGQLDGVEDSYVAAFPIRPPGSNTEQLVVAFSSTIPRSDEAAMHRLLVAIRNSVVLYWGFRPTLILELPKRELPKTSLGKIQRTRLRRRFEAGEFIEHEKWVTELTMRQLGGYTAPMGDTEKALAEVYAELFDADPATMSATASFFDLGGTSLDILRLKRRIEQTFPDCELPVIDILRAPTVRGLAERIDGGTRVTRYDPIVPLQTTGDGTPLFCVHPGVGEVLVFVNLAKYFVNERPFYALRARGFDEGTTYFTSFREMVDCYVDAIRSRQPSGPYAIAGYSYGGAVAFEIAKTLEGLGERVDFVGVFNLPPHIKDRMEELDYAEGAVNLAFFLSLVTKEQAATLAAELRGLPPQRILEHLIALAPSERLAELDLDLRKFGNWVDLAQSLVNLGRTYEPSGTVRSVSVFCAIPLHGTKEDWVNNALRKWDDFTREPNRYIDVPGEHYTMMDAQHVATFQAILRKELERALGS